MALPKRYPSPQDTAFVRLADIAAVMGWTDAYTRKFLAKFAPLLDIEPVTDADGWTRYPARAIEMLRAVSGQDYTLADPSNDWLANYLAAKDEQDATTET